MTPDDFPHGRCECTTGVRVGFRPCCGGEGPAAYATTRNGNVILVCTRCLTRTDGPAALLVTPDDRFKPYVKFDRLGAAVIMAEVSGAIAKEGIDEELTKAAAISPEKAEEVRKLRERIDAAVNRARNAGGRN